MKLAKEITFRGQWWLPAKPEYRVTGTASIDKQGVTTLEILGELERESASDEIAVLYGLEEDGTPLTVFNCHYTTYTSRPAGLESATLESQLLVGGAHLLAMDDILFSSVTIGYEHLDRWLGKSGISVKSDYAKHRAEISFQCPTPMRFGIMKDLALEIEFAWRLEGGFAAAPSRTSISQAAKLSLVSARPRSFSEFRELIFRLSYFFCFAMDRGVAPFEISARLSSDSATPIPVDHLDKISFFYPDYSPATTAPYYSHWNALFTFHTVENDFQVLISNWFSEYSNIEDSLDLYFSSSTIDHPLITTRLLLGVQALETLHRSTAPGTYVDEQEFGRLRSSLLESSPPEHSKWLERKLEFANEISLRERLKVLCEPLREHFPKGNKIKRLIDFTVSARNYYTHYSVGLKSKLVRDKNYWLLCEQLKAVFLLNLLGILKFPPEIVRKITDENGRIIFAIWTELD